jgi:DNA polymerase III delta subunit
MAAEMRPAYLFAGDDAAKLAATLSRLRARAEGEGGPGALEDFSGAAGAAPDPDGLIGAIPALSLTSERRYLLADAVERWKKADAESVAAALGAVPADVTVVLVARGKAPKPLAEAVEAAGGEVRTFAAPSKRDLPAWLVAGARERGFTLAPHAARALSGRIGASTERLAVELDRLATWAGEGGEVGVADVERMTADTSELRGWTLADAIVARDRERAVAVSEELIAQGDAVPALVGGMAKRLRGAYEAASALEAGVPAAEVERKLAMHPYAAKMLVRSVQGVDAAELSAAIGAVADLEWWTRGGSDYDDDVALTLAVSRAAGGTAVG